MAFGRLDLSVVLPEASKHSFEMLQILLVRTDTNDYVINVNVNT